MKTILNAILSATVLFGTSALADQEITNVAKTGTHYLNQYGLTVFVDSQNEALDNVSFKTALTDQGPIYYNEEREVFFKGTKPMMIRNGELALVDLELFDYVVMNMPDTINKVAPNEKVVVTMFTDFTCGWCQKVHENIDSYLSAGISFRFVLFPRNGVQSDQVANMMSTIVESDAPYENMQRLFKSQYIHASPLSPIIQNNFNVAMQLGLGGTPVFVINGYPYEGYLAPEQIIQTFVTNEG
jgi:thiol:disulfide interchange protein DsbC